MDWMDRERNIWVVGGDLRQRALARLLREDGHTVHIAALEGEGLAPEPLGPGLALAHCVILPLPVTQREEILHTPLSEEEVTLSQVLDYMEAGQILCGGLVSPAVRAAGEQRGLRVFDYYAREEYGQCVLSPAGWYAKSNSTSSPTFIIRNKIKKSNVELCIPAGIISYFSM